MGSFAPRLIESKVRNVRKSEIEGETVAIPVHCVCGHRFETRDENAGRRGRCPACQRELIVPQPKPADQGEFTPYEDFAPADAFAPVRTSGKAIASVILGIFPCIFTGIPAIILGCLSLTEIGQSKNRIKGRGLALTGVILGAVWSTFVVPAVLIALLLPAVQAARAAAQRAQCSNNEKQIALAMQNYVSMYDRFPPAAIYDQEGKPLLSWRVLILPFLDNEPLYARFHLDEPWDSPNNKPLAASMPQTYRCPSEKLEDPTLTTYEVIIDLSAIFTGRPQGVPMSSITDGMSNTILVTETNTPVPWTQPGGISLDDTEPQLSMGSMHPGGFNATMADGSVRFFKGTPRRPFDPQDLRSLCTRNGNEPVTPP